MTQQDRELPAGTRLFHCMTASRKALAGGNAPCLLKALLFDGLLQLRLYHKDRRRRLAHVKIFWGFMFRLLFPAIDGVLARDLFSSYVPPQSLAVFAQHCRAGRADGPGLTVH